MTNANRTLGPAAQYRHDHPRIRNVNQEATQAMSLGQRVADRVAESVGSWPFIIVQSVLLCIWMAFNAYLAIMAHTHPGYLKAWDPYPFILLNLLLSFQAAYTGPVVMMSQNRQADKDRLVAQSDYEVNRKSEEEIEVVMKHLVHQDKLLLDALARIESLQQSAPAEALGARLDELLARLDRTERALAALTPPGD